jgi:hypothetical protein
MNCHHENTVSHVTSVIIIDIIVEEQHQCFEEHYSPTHDLSTEILCSQLTHQLLHLLVDWSCLEDDRSVLVLDFSDHVINAGENVFNTAEISMSYENSQPHQQLKQNFGGLKIEDLLYEQKQLILDIYEQIRSAARVHSQAVSKSSQQRLKEEDQRSVDSQQTMLFGILLDEGENEV